MLYIFESTLKSEHPMIVISIEIALTSNNNPEKLDFNCRFHCKTRTSRDVGTFRLIGHDYVKSSDEDLLWCIWSRMKYDDIFPCWISISFPRLNIFILRRNILISRSKYFYSQAMLTTRNIFIANLAVSDILLCSFSMPLTLVDILTNYWTLGQNMAC